MSNLTMVKQLLGFTPKFNHFLVFCRKVDHEPGTFGDIVWTERQAWVSTWPLFNLAGRDNESIVFLIQCHKIQFSVCVHSESNKILSE